MYEPVARHKSLVGADKNGRKFGARRLRQIIERGHEFPVKAEISAAGSFH